MATVPHDLNHRRVLVTGASGRVGSALAARLQGLGAQVSTVVLPDDPARERVPDDVAVILGSLEDRDCVRAAVDGVDFVVHLAALMDWSAGANQRLFDANVRGTFNVLDVAASSAHPIRQLVIASSDEVYPALDVQGEIHEALPTLPYSFYGLTKLLDEHMAHYYQRAQGLPVSIARFSLTAGPAELLREDGWSGRLFHATGLRTILNALGRAEAVRTIDAAVAHLEGTLLLARGEDGASYEFQFCDVRDLVDGLVLQLTHPTAVGGVFNLSGPSPTRYDIAVPAIAERVGRPYVDVRLPGEALRVHTSTEAAARAFGYAPRHDVGSILAELADA